MYRVLKKKKHESKYSILINLLWIGQEYRLIIIQIAIIM